MDDRKSSAGVARKKSPVAKRRPRSQRCPPGYFCVPRALLFTSIVSELLEYFDVPSISGVTLSEYQARYIANGILDRVPQDERLPIELPKEKRQSGPLRGQSGDAS